MAGIVGGTVAGGMFGAAAESVIQMVGPIGGGPIGALAGGLTGARASC
jgi:hypothetical protein